MTTLIRKATHQGTYDAFLGSEGVQFGFGIFETIACTLRKDGLVRLIDLEGHLNRLFDSAKALEIHLPDREEIAQALNNYGRDLWKATCMADDSPVEIHVAIKLTVLKDHDTSELLLSNRPNPYHTSCCADSKGFRLTLSECVRDEKSILTYHKTNNYMTNILEKRSAVRQQADDCFFLNRKGYITETSTANLFFLKNGKIMTPQLSCGILPGTVRAKLLSGGQIEESFLDVLGLNEVEGAAVTNSLMGVKAVTEMAGHRFEKSDELVSNLNTMLKELDHDHDDEDLR